MADNKPNQTLYVHNLNEKAKKDELKKSLYAIFSQFGPVLEVIVSKSWRLRGQAWVVFQDQASASNALRKLQDFPFMDKRMKIEYARETSDVIAQDQGITIDKAARAEERKRKDKEYMEKVSEKRAKIEEEGGEQKKSSRAIPAQRQEPPNNILFVENLPEQCNEQMLSVLFNQFPGLKEVRMVPGKRGISFVEYENEPQATLAMKELQHFKFTQEDIIVISYAKK